MSTLVLRLAGPWLAWPGPQRLRIRHTAPEPTYSALVGLTRSARGLPRLTHGETPTELRAAVRVDRAGLVRADFHTVNPYPVERLGLSAGDEAKVRRENKRAGAPTESPIVLRKYYREDATYLAFLDDPDQALRDAFTSPAFALYAGRKGCPLTFPFVLGSVPLSLEEAASAVPAVNPTTTPIEAHFYQQPAELPVHAVSEHWDQPAGRVGVDYAPRSRYVTTVTAPTVRHWTEQIAAIEELTR